MTAPEGLSEFGLRRVLAVLCLTPDRELGRAVYAFPVLAPGIGADTGWSRSATTGAFSVGLVVSAGAGIPVGRLLDRIGPRPVMTVGSLLAVPAVLGIAPAPDLGWFVAGWVLAGLAMAGTLYPPAFAALTRWWGPRRITALTVLTLLAGLSSTIFAPSTAAVADHLGWRALRAAERAAHRAGTRRHRRGPVGRRRAGRPARSATPPSSPSSPVAGWSPPRWPADRCRPARTTGPRSR